MAEVKRLPVFLDHKYGYVARGGQMRSKPSIPKSLVAGAVGGLAGAFLMNQFQSAMKVAEKETARRRGEHFLTNKSGDDATVKTAQAVSQHLFDRSLTRAQKQWAGPAVHYAFGAAVGALYGVLVETLPVTKSVRGIAYGAAVWLGADEIAVPAFGLSKPFRQTPMAGHMKALASHLVYGFTTDLARRAILRRG